MGDEYAPVMLVGVWLYAYALGVTSSRRLEQRVREDLAFHYLAGGATPDFWTLNRFRRRHARVLNDLFTQVVELARAAGLGRLGNGYISLQLLHLLVPAELRRCGMETQKLLIEGLTQKTFPRIDQNLPQISRVPANLHMRPFPSQAPHTRR